MLQLTSHNDLLYTVFFYFYIIMDLITEIPSSSTQHNCVLVFKLKAIRASEWEIGMSNQRTNGPVNAHMISEQIVSIKYDYKF